MAPLVNVIDDDDAVRDSAHLLLESYGYRVRGFASPHDFLGRAKAKPDCLIVDQHMPGMTGLEFIELLRARGDRTPALMITGRIDPTIGPRAEQLGMGILQKPFDESQLVLWIEAVVQSGGIPPQGDEGPLLGTA